MGRDRFEFDKYLEPTTIYFPSSNFESSEYKQVMFVALSASIKILHLYWFGVKRPQLSHKAFPLPSFLLLWQNIIRGLAAASFLQIAAESSVDPSLANKIEKFKF
jgi:hypothetical protein